MSGQPGGGLNIVHGDTEQLISILVRKHW